MAENVIFKRGLRAQFDALTVKDGNTLYWLSDTQELYMGDILYGTGKIGELIPADASLIIDDDSIRVALSGDELNALELREDGLFVAVPSVPLVPEFEIERQDAPTDGFAASYRLKRTLGEEVSYVGDTINIPKDLVLQNASLQTVVMADQPYVGAQVGDPYIDLVFNDENNSHMYIPVKELVDTYVPGAGITITDGVVGLKLSAVDANGLFVSDDGLGLKLATRESAGAMSAVDKLALDSVPAVYQAKRYEVVGVADDVWVDYRDKEIRVMFPETTAWKKQNVGATGNANMFYFPFRAYAPSADVVAFREDMDTAINDTTVHTFDESFSGVDEYGRKYSVVWLAAAQYDESSDTWSYFGKSSTESRMIGWYYTVEWLNADGTVVETDTIRIGLTNEACHRSIQPEYVVAMKNDMKALQDSVAAIEKVATWGEM